MRDLKFNKNKTSKYIISPLYLLDENVIIILTFRKIHIIDDLKINILINMNIIISKQIDILTFQSKAKINNYNIIIFIIIHIKNRAVIQSIYIKKFIIIFSHIQLTISIHYINLLNQNFFFEPDQLNLTLYTHFINSSLYIILIKNNSNQHIKILKNLRFNIIQKVDFDNCYHIIFKKKMLLNLLIVILKKNINKIKLNEFSKNLSLYRLSLY